MTVLIIAIIIVAVLAHHAHHVRRNRRRGLSLWISLRGPWGTRISKRL